MEPGASPGALDRLIPSTNAITTAACAALGRGIGGPEGLGAWAICQLLAEQVEKRRAAGSSGTLAETSQGVSPRFPPPCGDDVGLVLEAAEDPDCRPYWFEQE